MVTFRSLAVPGLWLGLLAAIQPGAALAKNFINIDTGITGSVGTLAIAQDANAPSNTVSGTAGINAPFTVAGAWKNIAITQAGASNQLTGAIGTSATLPGSNNFSANYSHGNNVHSVNIGRVNTPSSVAETVSVANTGTSTNTITEVLDSTGALVNGLTIYGTGNSVTNTVAAPSGITLNQILGDGGSNGTASRNTVINSASSLSGAYASMVKVSGDGASTGMTNAISNIANGTGVRSFSTTLNGSSNTATYSLLNGGSGTTQQSAALTADSLTRAQYAVSSKATGTSSVNTTLSNVVGGVYVQQNADISSGRVTLTVNGNGNTLGNLTSVQATAVGMDTTGLPSNFFGTNGANPGIALIQSSVPNSSNPMTATVNVAAKGYTTTIITSNP